MNQTDLAQGIRQAALDCGFDNCGIIPISDMDGFENYRRQRIKNVPSSGVFYKAAGEQPNVQARFPWAKSVVICTYDYSKYRYPKELRGRFAKAYFLAPEPGRTDGYDLSAFQNRMTDMGIRFAGGEDLGHTGIGSLRHGAEMAGLGIVRKNNFFYTESGSYVLLMGFVIDRECSLIHENKLLPCSDKCDLCQKACRTKSLSAPHTMDPLKCVSFWTTFGKGVVPPGLTEDMYEQWLCGCDNCQDACPYNRKHNWDEGSDFSNLAEIAPLLTPEKILEAADEFLREQVIPKTSNHMQPSDTEVLRKNAHRAVRYSRTSKK